MDDPLRFLGMSEVASLLLISAASAITVQRLFPRLRTDAAPYGIVSLQLAFTAPRAKAIVSSWQSRRLDGAAKRSLFVDVPFIVFYAWSLGALAVVAGRATAGRPLASDTAYTLGAALAIAGWTAGALDLLENVGLWVQLTSRVSGVITALTSAASVAKFALAIGSSATSLGLLLAAFAARV